MQDTRFEGAKQLFTSLKNAFLTLPDHVQVFPGHGAGSACGKAIGALPSTTVGYERKFAWWAKHLAADDEQGFIDELLDGQPDAHAYFARMKRQNKDGPALLGERRAPRLLTADELSRGRGPDSCPGRHPPRGPGPRRDRAGGAEHPLARPGRNAYRLGLRPRER